MRSLKISNEGAVHEPDYAHRYGYVQECFQLHGVDAAERPVLRKAMVPEIRWLSYACTLLVMLAACMIFSFMASVARCPAAIASLPR